MAVRQREVDAVLASLDRTIRLASLVFLLLAGGLAQSVARRISGPIRDLTRASRRIAAGDLDARVTPQSQDELRELMEAFNQMARDLDSQRRDIRRSHRLAAWAEMARQVAHEVKNPLTPIQLSAEHLRRVYRDPGADFAAALETCTQSILKQVRSLRGIVTEFSAFARPPSEPPETLDLGELLRGIVRPYEVAAPAGISLSLEVGRDLPVVQGDRRLLERAAVNLIENALDAVRDGGVVQLRASPTKAGGVRVEVEDSGVGFDAQTAARAFEPSFSTRTGGSGLGLALVKKIAEDHGGSVAIEPRARGTRIVMWLPPTVRPEAARASDQEP
jgi:nitrogen fixation/metabolism regulation signal transduction histidine kinase